MYIFSRHDDIKVTKIPTWVLKIKNQTRGACEGFLKTKGKLFLPFFKVLCLWSKLPWVDKNPYLKLMQAKGDMSRRNVTKNTTLWRNAFSSEKNPTKCTLFERWTDYQKDWEWKKERMNGKIISTSMKWFVY